MCRSLCVPWTLVCVCVCVRHSIAVASVAVAVAVSVFVVVGSRRAACYECDSVEFDSLSFKVHGCQMSAP